MRVEVLCLSLRDNLRKKKRKLGIYCLLDKKKNKFFIGNSLCIYLRGSRSVYYTSNTSSENSLSSFAKVSEVTSNVGATLLSF